MGAMQVAPLQESRSAEAARRSDALAGVREEIRTAEAAPRSDALAGVRAIAPLVIGLVPLAVTVGATAARADLPPLVGWVSSVTLYGATAQLTLAEVLGGGGPAALAVATTVVVNLQLLLYGAAMRRYWAAHPRRWRAGAAALLVSPLFAVASSHHRDEPDPRRQRRFYVAAGLTLWLAWLGLTGVGYAVGGGLPALSVLTLITPLVVLTLALRAVTDTATGVALVVAAIVAAGGLGVPYDLGFVAAGLLGVAAGVIAEGLVPAKMEKPGP
jgi:predicted branched-subunit amino acid permease